jgi:hypothetical protein
MKPLAMAVLCAVLSIPAVAQETAEPEPILFPILSKPFAGALGSFWTTEAWMMIDSDEPVGMFPLLDCVFCEERLPRRQAFMPPLFYQQPGHPPGTILWVSGDAADDIAVSLRVRESSHAAAGVQIPVVRQSELYHRTLHLLDIPWESNVRRHLRIYDVDARPGAAVRIRVFALEATVPRLEIDRPFTFSPAHNPNFSRPVTPGFIQIDFQEFAEVVGIGRARIEVQPLTPDLRFWAFLTMTDLTTQEFTLITPE